MPFVDDVSPQYRSKLLRARSYIWMLESLGGEGLGSVQDYVGPGAVLPDGITVQLSSRVRSGLEEGKGLSADQVVSPYKRAAQDDLEEFIRSQGIDASGATEDVI